MSGRRDDIGYFWGDDTPLQVRRHVWEAITSRHTLAEDSVEKVEQSGLGVDEIDNAWDLHCHRHDVEPDLVTRYISSAHDEIGEVPTATFGGTVTIEFEVETYSAEEAMKAVERAYLGHLIAIDETVEWDEVGLPS